MSRSRFGLGVVFALVAVASLVSAAGTSGSLHDAAHGRVWLPAAGLAAVAFLWRGEAFFRYSRPAPESDRFS